MNFVQKQSILLIIQGLEAQLSALKNIVALNDTKEEIQQVKNTPRRAHYLSPEEDRELENALKIEDTKDIFLQDIFKEAQEKKIDDVPSNECD